MGLLGEAFLFMIAAVLLVPLFKALGLGSVLGYLTGGILIGPAVLGLVHDVEETLHVAELGVVLLLFLIGLELQPSRLWTLRKPIFGMGGAQVIGSAALIAAAAWALGMVWQGAIVIGVALALSSTAFGLQILSERGHLRTTYGRNAFAILLFQDLAVVPILALLPLLAPTEGAPRGWVDVVMSVALAVAVIGGTIVIGRLALSRALSVIVGTRVPELFTVSALALVMGVSLLMEASGLSMALGAFLAGVLLADSEYRHELEATIEPFKGLLLGLFFLAVGMTVDLSTLVNAPGTVAALVAGLLTVKGLVLYGIARWFSASPRSALSLAALMSQGGEFGFVIFGLARVEGIMAPEDAALMLVVVTVSMALTPFLVSANTLLQNRRPKPRQEPVYDTIVPDEGNRVIIAGFGRFGQIVARTLRMAEIPFTALESDFEQIGFVRRFGSKVHYGDPARPDLLRAAGIEHAEVFVIAVEEPEKALRIAEYVRKRHPQVRLLARARNRAHAYKLMELGVYKVFRETYGSSLEMAEEVFVDLGYAPEMARRAVHTFRAHDEALMEEQYVVRDDEKALIATAQQAAEELRSLFEQDQNDKDAWELQLPPLEQQGEICRLPSQPDGKGSAPPPEPAEQP